MLIQIRDRNENLKKIVEVVKCIERFTLGTNRHIDITTKELPTDFADGWYIYTLIPNETNWANCDKWRVEKYTKINSDEGILYKIYAVHILCELLDESEATFTLTDSSANDAITQALSNVPDWSPGTVDVTGTESLKIERRTSILEILQNIASKWNGELYFNNNRTVDFKKSIGSDNKLWFRIDKNIKSLKVEYDAASVITRLYIFGKDGLDISSVNAGLKYLDSEYINNYPRPKIGVKETQIDNATKLKAYGEDYLSKVEIPRAVYDIDITDLSTLTNYPNDKFEIGDTIVIHDSELNIRVSTRIKEITRNYCYPEESSVKLANTAELLSRYLADQRKVTKVYLPPPYESVPSYTDVPWDNTEPVIPTGLSIDSSGTKQNADGIWMAWIKVNWNANTEDDFSHYEISIRRDAGNYKYNYTTPNSMWIYPLLTNTLYYVAVRAIDKTGNKSDWCSEVSYTTAKDEQAPATPTGLTATAGIRKIIIEWNDNTEADFSHYELYRNTTNDSGTATKLENYHGSITAIDGDADTTYYFWLKAVDLSGNKSGFSTVASATTGKVETVDVSDTAITIAKLKATFSNNLARNTSFESWTYKGSGTSWSPPTMPYWDFNKTASDGRAYLYNEPKQSREGLYHFRVKALGTDDTKYVDLRTNGDNLIRVEASTKYNMSVYCRHFGNHTSIPQFNLYIQWLDNDKTIISSSNLGRQNFPSGLTRYSFSATSPSNAYYVKVYMRTYATADGDPHPAMYDCVQFEEGGEATPWNEAGQTVIDGDTLKELSVKTSRIDNLAVITEKINDLAVNASKLATDAVTTTKIADLAVTNAKIAELAVTTAKIAELGVTSAKIANLAVGEGKIADLAVSEAKIADLAVNTGKIVDLAVNSAKIANLAVISTKIGDLAVLEAKIADLAVSTGKIANLAVTNAKIANLAVDEAKIADLAVSTAKIGNLAVTDAKIDTLGATKVVISGATTLADWRGTDQTKLGGGWIETGTIYLEKLIAKLSNNLAHNTSFESWTAKGSPTSWSIPVMPYWTFARITANINDRLYLYTETPAISIEGNYNIRSRASGEADVKYIDIQTAFIRVKPSTEYTASIYEKSHTDGANKPNIRMYIMWYDESQDYISATDTGMISPAYTLTRHTKTGTSPDNAYYAKIYLRTFAIATPHTQTWDCFQFEEGREATPWNEAGQTVVIGETIRSGNIILDGHTENYVLVKDKQATPKDRVKLGKIGTATNEYGLLINDASGNTLVNLYNPSDFRINAPVYIAPCYTKAWAAWPTNGVHHQYDHNLGFIPTHRNAEGKGNPNNIPITAVPAGEDYVVCEEFYAAFDICWISETRFQYYTANTTGRCDQWRVRFLR